ncbi:MAG: hypothetical protein ACI4E0_06115 [Blautia sp.]
MIWITGAGTILILLYLAVTGRWAGERFDDCILPVRWVKSSGYYLYCNVLRRIYRPVCPEESKNYRRLQQIYAKKDISEEWMKYQAEKYGVILTGILAFCLVGNAVFAAGNREEILDDYVLIRPEYGESSEEYSFQVRNGEGDQESIHLTLEPQVYSGEEVQQKFEAYYEILKEKVRGDNESLQKVRKKLNFESDSAWTAIDITWRPSDYDLITEEGEILLDQAQEGKTELSLYLVMTHAQYSRTFEIPVTIVKYSSDASLDMQSYLEKEQESSMEEKYFKLPATFNGEKIQYVVKKECGTAVGIILLIAATVFLILYRQQASVKEQCARRERQMKADYPEIISKLLVLVRAGMPVRSAWTRIAEDYQIQKQKDGQVHFALEEMNMAVKEMNTGVSEGMAYLEFGRRCDQQIYLKLGSLLEQNLKKGSYGIAVLLEGERIQALEERKRQIRSEGELAGTRLMAPMMVLFALVLMIIMVPSLMSFGI